MNQKDMNKENEQIRANRLSNREVVLSSAARALTHTPSASHISESKPNIPMASCSTTNRTKIIDTANDQSPPTANKIANADEDEQYLSQYEIDIVNKYLNELGDDDDDDDGDALVASDLGINSILQSSHANANVDDTSDDESEQRSVIEVIDVMAVQSHDNDAIIDNDSQCNQTSRRTISFEQPNQANANNADVNNNNMSLIGIASNPSDGQQNRSSQRHRFCEPNRRTNTNATNMNLPIIVGITSCVWGLCLFAMKSFYSDLT